MTFTQWPSPSTGMHLGYYQPRISWIPFAAVDTQCYHDHICDRPIDEEGTESPFKLYVILNCIREMTRE